MSIASPTPPSPGVSKSMVIMAVLLIAMGVGWLLTVMEVGPDIEWVWTLSLGVLGLLVFVLSGGVDKVSLVFGPFLLMGSFFSILRQSGHLSINYEVPLLTILMGVLILVAQSPMVPLPRWYTPMKDEDETKDSSG